MALGGIRESDEVMRQTLIEYGKQNLLMKTIEGKRILRG